jgi:hypothetical protein
VLLLNPDIIEGQISITRRVMRLPKLQSKEKYQLAELLKMLHQLRKHLEDSEYADLEQMAP